MIALKSGSLGQAKACPTNPIVGYALACPARRQPGHAISQRAHGVLHHGVLALIVVFGAQIGNLCIGEIQLRIGQFDDGSQTEIVAALSQLLRLRSRAEHFRLTSMR